MHPAVTDTTIWEEIPWKMSMQMTFHAEAALVRPQIACGTHALAVALSGNLRPGDELSPLWESPTTLWKRLSASVPPEVLLQNTESLTDRQICFLTAALIMKISKRQ